MLTTRFSVVPMSMRERGGGDAVEADPGAVGGDGEGLGAVAAVDLDGVDAGAALVEVGAVARVPDHPVVARLAEDLVVAVAAGQDVVAVAAEQQVVAALAQQGVVARLAEEQVGARAAGERVVAGAAEDVRLRQGAVGLVQGEVVVAAQAEDLDQAGVGDGGLPAQDRYGAAVDQDRPGRVAADHDGVVLRIADNRQHPLRGGERGRDRRQDAAIEQLEAGEVGQANASRRPLTARASVLSITKLRLPHEHHLQGCKEDSGSREAPETVSGYGPSTSDRAGTDGHAGERCFWRSLEGRCRYRRP